MTFPAVILFAKLFSNFSGKMTSRHKLLFSQWKKLNQFWPLEYYKFGLKILIFIELSHMKKSAWFILNLRMYIGQILAELSLNPPFANYEAHLTTVFSRENTSSHQFLRKKRLRVKISRFSIKWCPRTFKKYIQMA